VAPPRLEFQASEPPEARENKADRTADVASESTGRAGETDLPKPAVTAGGPEPLTVEVLRRKLDAAIVAEAWDAVKAVRERLIEAERNEAGNVVALDPKRRQRGA